MGLTYLDAACLLFRRSVFTAGDFSRATGNPRGAKVLSEMKSRGLVERVGRGRYRCLGPEERIDRRRGDSRRLRHLLVSAPFEKAWTGPSSLETAAAAGLQAPATSFAPEYHLAVLKKDLRRWRAYLRHHRVALAARKHIGPRVFLRPVPSIPRRNDDDQPPAFRAGVPPLVAGRGPSGRGVAGRRPRSRSSSRVS